MQKKAAGLLARIRNLLVLQSIRYGLVTLIPILMAGSFALVMRSLPLDSYQRFIAGWGGGILYGLFDGLFNVTFGMLSVYTAAVVGYHYGILHEKQEKKYGHAALLVSLGCFLYCRECLAAGLTPLPQKACLPRFFRPVYRHLYS